MPPLDVAAAPTAVNPAAKLIDQLLKEGVDKGQDLIDRLTEMGITMSGESNDALAPPEGEEALAPQTTMPEDGGMTAGEPLPQPPGQHQINAVASKLATDPKMMM